MNTNFDPEILDQMCQQIDLLEYASNSMNFELKGQKNYFTNCPLHTDKTPSLSINQHENKFYCFSCHKGGNIIGWLMNFEGLSYKSAVEKIAKLTNTELSVFQQSDAMKTLKKLNRLKFHSPNNDATRQILSISELDKFSKDIPQEWVDEGINPETMELFNIRIDHKSNRIVYPIWDAQFNLIGFKGRTRYPNFKALKIQKYMNYTKIGKQDFFVGMKEQEDQITPETPIIIFEGIKSVMKAFQWGYTSLAAETSYLNEYQINLLLSGRYKDITIAFDTDVEYKKIAECVKTLKRFTNVYVVLDRTNMKNKLLGEKESPTDRGYEIFEKLLNERRRIT